MEERSSTAAYALGGLLPIAVAGAMVGVRGEIDATNVALVLVLIVVATAGKFGGTLAAARVSGMDWRHAAGLGILMNTRGLMQLIVLSLGLDLGVISPRLFAMMVLMALVTTIATTPVLQLLGSFAEPDV